MSFMQVMKSETRMARPLAGCQRDTKTAFGKRSGKPMVAAGAPVSSYTTSGTYLSKNYTLTTICSIWPL